MFASWGGGPGRWAFVVRPFIFSRHPNQISGTANASNRLRRTTVTGNPCKFEARQAFRCAMTAQVLTNEQVLSRLRSVTRPRIMRFPLMHRTLLALLLATCLLVPFSYLSTATRAQNQLPQDPLTNSDIFLMLRAKISVAEI